MTNKGKPMDSLKIGDRVAIIESEKVTRDLWWRSGVIEKIDHRPETAYRRQEPDHYLMRLDDQSFRMKAVWVYPHMVTSAPRHETNKDPNQ